MTKELAELIENNVDIDGKYYCILEKDNDNSIAFHVLVQHEYNTKLYAKALQENINKYNPQRKVYYVPMTDLPATFFIELYLKQLLKEDKNVTK
jgi:hypothetical protein